jgi:adenylosuccinate lyase
MPLAQSSTGERLTGLARVIRGNAVAAMKTSRFGRTDISHSSVERIIFLIQYSARLYARDAHKATDGLIVAGMAKNLGLSLGMWNSQTVLLALIKKGLTREAYDLVQRNAMKTWQAKHAGTNADFKTQLLSDGCGAAFIRG